MARINIDDELFNHGGFKALVSLKGKIIAQGIMVEAYQLAQFYWCNLESLHSGIPLKVFSADPMMQLLIEFGLANTDGDSVFIWDSEAQFQWLIAQRLNGRKGGRPTAPKEPTGNPRETHGNPTGKPTDNPTATQSEPIHNPLFSLLSSPSFSKEKEEENTRHWLAELWNERAFKSLPRVKEIGDKRKRHIEARLKKYPTKEHWEKIIAMVNESDFLTGKSNSNWKANFDWLVSSQANCNKLLEGNYKNKSTTKSYGHTTAPEDEFYKTVQQGIS